MFFLPFSRYRPSTLIWSSPPLLKEMWHCSLRSCLTDKQKWLRCGLISKEKRDRHNPHFTSYIPIHRTSTTVCPSVVWHSIIIIRHGRTGKSFPANPIIIFTIIRLQEFFRRIQSDNQMPFSDYSHKDECSSFLVLNLCHPAAAPPPSGPRFDDWHYDLMNIKSFYHWCPPTQPLCHSIRFSPQKVFD